MKYMEESNNARNSTKDSIINNTLRQVKCIFCVQASHHRGNRGTPTARAAVQPARALTQFIFIDCNATHFKALCHRHNALLFLDISDLCGGIIMELEEIMPVLS